MLQRNRCAGSFLKIPGEPGHPTRPGQTWPLPVDRRDLFIKGATGVSSRHTTPGTCPGPGMSPTR